MRLLFLFAFALIISPMAKAATMYQVNNATASTINEHGICRHVTNNFGRAIMIPTRTSTEWSSFINNPPSGVSLANCTCALPWGGSIASGSSVTAYSAGFNTSCAGVDEVRTCSGNTLSGSFTYKSCMEASYTDTAFQDGGNDPTFTGISFGATAGAGRTRYILVAAGARIGGDITGVKVAGITATQLVSRTNGAPQARFFIAAVPTGTSGSVQVLTSVSAVNVGIGVWRLTDPDPTPYDTASASSDTGASCSMTINTISDGFLAAYMMTRHDATVTHTWSGSTERFDFHSTGNVYAGHSGASTSDTGAQTGRSVAINPSAGHTHACVAVSFRREQ